MRLSEVKKILAQLENIGFRLANGTPVPEHFHVTEVGKITKHFIDCGGTVRSEQKVGFQLWTANDFNHRLKAQKMLNIIDLSEKKLGLEDSEIEVEYQGETIGKFHLDFDGKDFVLITTTTTCLAEDSCGIPKEKTKIRLGYQNTCCSSDENCC